MYLKSPKSGLRNPVRFSDDDWGVQSSPKPIVFSFHYHSQKVIGSLGWGFVLSGSFSLLSFLGNCPFWGTTPDHQKTSSGPQGCLENARSSSWCMCCHTNTVAMGPWYFRWQGALGSWMVSCWQLRIIDFWVVVSNICYFEPYLGKWSNLTNIFQRGWNHQLDLVWFGHISLIVSQFRFFLNVLTRSFDWRSSNLQVFRKSTTYKVGPEPSYKWSHNLYKSPSKWVTWVRTPISGVLKWIIFYIYYILSDAYMKSATKGI